MVGSWIPSTKTESEPVSVGDPITGVLISDNGGGDGEAQGKARLVIKAPSESGLPSLTPYLHLIERPKLPL